MINPRDILAPSPQLSVELDKLVGLDGCPIDDRPLILIQGAQANKSTDDSIIESVGGLNALFARRASMGQLVREIGLALDGEKGLFKKGQHYLLYMEGLTGICPVRAGWRPWIGRWSTTAYDGIGYAGSWREDIQVYGN